MAYNEQVSPEHQRTLYTHGKSAKTPEAVIANVWNWDNQWKIKWLEDGILKGSMEQIRCADMDGQKKP